MVILVFRLGLRSGLGLGVGAVFNFLRTKKNMTSNNEPHKDSMIFLTRNSIIKR